MALAEERIRSAHDAQQAKLQVEAERLRSSLLSAVSHDLRTPLAAIAGASSTLVDGDGLDPQTRHELAESIFEESERLNRLVANLLDMTRLEAGALQVRKEWQVVEEVVGVVLNRLSRRLQRYKLVTHLPHDLPLVPFDPLLDSASLDESVGKRHEMYARRGRNLAVGRSRRPRMCNSTSPTGAWGSCPARRSMFSRSSIARCARRAARA